MPYDPERHQRRSLRLAGYDHSQDGIYLVTLCVHERRCTLGTIRNNVSALNAYGEVVVRCWLAIPDHYSTVRLDAWVVMPNHLHGIIILTNTQQSGARATLGAVVGSFKSAVSRQINARQDEPQTFWQRGYYEHIIRNKRSLARLRRYIAENPARWSQDQLYPDAPPWR